MTAEPSRFAVPLPQSSPALRSGGLHDAPAAGVAFEAAVDADAALLAFVQQRIQPIPRARSDAPVPLAGVIGAAGVQQIRDAGAVVFHAVGDTGHGDHSPQSDVATAMAQDYTLTDPAHSPAFFLHLGDVIYGANKDAAYRDQYYVPNRQYPGKIVAIAGNHDGEVLPPTDPDSLRAFLANFCATTAEVPAVAGTVYRETGTLPGVYWLLDAPFVQIVCLYSNVAENPGFLSGPVAGSVQKDWLVATLRAVRAARAAGTRKALVFATHHPPFSSGGHAGSTAMLADLDDACHAAGDVWPDLVLSAHAHNYQRYTRRVPVGNAAGAAAGGATRTIPYLVAGGGGHGLSPVPAASGQVTGDHTFEASDAGYGYLVVRASAAEVRVEYYAVNGAAKAARDTVTVALTAG